jgi:hypothetical protein
MALPMVIAVGGAQVALALLRLALPFLLARR